MRRARDSSSAPRCAIRALPFARPARPASAPRCSRGSSPAQLRCPTTFAGRGDQAWNVPRRFAHGLQLQSCAVDIVPEPIEQYAERHTTQPEPLLAELAHETRETPESPQMLTGTVEGRFLEMLVYARGAKRVLELGTYSGYSALSMAAGLPDGGHIDTCEADETHAEVARRYIAESPYADRITVHLGPALDTIKQLEGEFDFVFIDADKENYLNYYEALLPRLAPRGLIAIDNTLWIGRVLDEDDDSEATKAIREINDRIANDDRVVAVQLSVRDGVTLVRRRA